MADITMKMGTYKLVSISVKTNAPDYLGQSSAARQFVIYKDAPLLAMRTYKVQALTITTTSPDILMAASAAREFLLYTDAPNLAMRMYKTNAITVDTLNPDKLAIAAGLRYAFIITPPLGMASAARQVFIINQAETGPAIYTPQVFSLAAQHANWPPVADIFSTSSEIQTVQQALVKNTDNAFLWSKTRVAEMPMLALMSRPATQPISYNKVARVAQEVLRASPIDTQSWKSLAQAAHLTLISLDRVPVPTSGAFVQEYTTLALMDKPMNGMPSSASMDLQVVTKVLQRNAEPFPRSSSRVPQVTTMALVPNTLPLARGAEQVPQHFIIALQANPMPPMNDPSYHQPVEAAQDFQLTLMKQALAFPWVGAEHSAQSAITVLQKVIVEPVFGVQHDKLLTTLVLQSSPLPKPGGMSGANMPEIRTTVLLGADGYPAASSIRSKTRVSQAGLQWLVDATYQKPGDIVSGSKYSFYRTLHIQTVVSRVQPLPWSNTRVPEVRLLTTMRADYDSPEKVLSDGIFVTVLGEQVMAVAQYPTTGEPVSQLTVDIIGEQLVETDDTFPDKSYSTSDLQATSVAEQLAASDDSFPDKDLVQSKLQVDIVGEQLIQNDISFPDKDLAQSDLVLTQITEAVAASAGDYPPKDMVQSQLVVTALVENVVTHDTFPDKDMPQSTIAVTQTVEQILAVDDSMKGMPQYQGRRKPTIFVQIVY